MLGGVALPVFAGKSLPPVKKMYYSFVILDIKSTLS
jgi:hypothetical protein